MNSPTCASPIAQALGSMPDGRVLANYIGIRTTRRHLLSIGHHVDLSLIAEQMGFRVPVFWRREAFNQITGDLCQFHDSRSDLYDAMLAMRQAIMKSPLRDLPVPFQVGEVSLVAHPGRLDHDDPRLAFTVVLATNQDEQNDGGQDDE